MKDPTQKRPNHPFVVFNPPDAKEQNPDLGGKPSAQQTVDPETPKTGDPPPYSKTSTTKKKKIIKEALKDHIRRRQIRLYRIDEALNPSNDFNETLGEFIHFASSYIGVNELPTINLKQTADFSPEAQTFGVYSPSDRAITLSVTNRHPMDVFRSLAHELVHHKQNEDEVLQAESGQTGSEHENEANSMAGVIMRDFAKANPDFFKLDSISESRNPLITMAIKHFFKSSSGGRTRKPKADDDFETKVTKGVEREKLKAAIKSRLEKEKGEKSSAKTSFDAYSSSIHGASLTHSDSARKGYLDKARVQAQNLGNHGVDVNPARDLNSLRHKVVKPKPTPGRKPPPAMAEETVTVMVHTAKGNSYSRRFPNQAQAAAWKQKQLERGSKGRKIEIRETIALVKKSERAQIPYPIILEVYQRGLQDWNPSTKLTREQYAFNRVNSFIAGGKSRTELDKDLLVFIGDL